MVLSIATCQYTREVCERRPLRSGDLNPHDPMKMHIHNGLWPVSTGALRMVVYQPSFRITAERLTPGMCLSRFQVVVVVGFPAVNRISVLAGHRNAPGVSQSD